MGSRTTYLGPAALAALPVIILIGLYSSTYLTAGQPAATPSAGAKNAPAGPQPKIELVAPVYHFGTVLNGPPIKHVFTVKNAGRADLVIGQVMASCGCTVAKPTRTHLKPGESSRIDVSVDTRVLSGHSAHTVTLVTNDPANPNPVLKVEGDVKLQVTATPSSVDFGKVARGSEAAREVVLTALTEKGFEIGEVKNSNPNIKVVRVPGKRGSIGTKFRIELLKTTRVGPFVDTIDIATNRLPVKVSVYGKVSGPIDANPAQVSFGIVPHQASAIRFVRLTNSGPRDMKVLGISSSNRSVTAAIEPIKPGREYKVTVLLRKNTPDGQLRGQLEIKTDDPGQAIVTIPYYGIIGTFKS